MTNSINKGKSAERDVVNILKAKGVPAKRISMMETGGIDKGDVRIADVWTAQIKCGSHVPKRIYDFMNNGEDFLIMRRDRSRWIIAMDLDRFIERFL